MTTAHACVTIAQNNILKLLCSQSKIPKYTGKKQKHFQWVEAENI